MYVIKLTLRENTFLFHSSQNVHTGTSLKSRHPKSEQKCEQLLKSVQNLNQWESGPKTSLPLLTQEDTTIKARQKENKNNQN